MNHTPNYKHVGYLEQSIRTENLKKTVSLVAKVLKPLEFDAIAFRGMSGALVAPAVALKLNKTLIMVRKGEKTHSSRTAEGDAGARRYVIVDDLVDSGQTVEEIFNAVCDFTEGAVCIGIVQYAKLERGFRSIRNVGIFGDFIRGREHLAL